MATDWNSKSTGHLKLILGSLVRFEANAKSIEEKIGTAKSISEITRVLNEREK